jgi:hypothetical protein
MTSTLHKQALRLHSPSTCRHRCLCGMLTIYHSNIPHSEHQARRRQLHHPQEPRPGHPCRERRHLAHTDHAHAHAHRDHRDHHLRLTRRCTYQHRVCPMISCCTASMAKAVHKRIRIRRAPALAWGYSSQSRPAPRPRPRWFGISRRPRHANASSRSSSAVRASFTVRGAAGDK